MALFKLGLIITEARGKLGGQALQMQGGRCVALGTKKPKANYTFYSGFRQINHITVVRGWKSLTSTQKNAWNLFARTPQASSYYVNSGSWSGFNWFCSCNKSIPTLSGIPFLLPPVLPRKYRMLSISATMSVATHNGFFNISSIFQANTFLAFYMSPPFSAGRSYKKDDFHLIATRSNTASPQFFNITEIISVLGYMPKQGSAVWWKIQPVERNTGTFSIPFYIKIIVGA